MRLRLRAASALLAAKFAANAEAEQDKGGDMLFSQGTASTHVRPFHPPSILCERLNQKNHSV